VGSNGLFLQAHFEFSLAYL